MPGNHMQMDVRNFLSCCLTIGDPKIHTLTFDRPSAIGIGNFVGDCEEVFPGFRV